MSSSSTVISTRSSRSIVMHLFTCVLYSRFVVATSGFVDSLFVVMRLLTHAVGPRVRRLRSTCFAFTVSQSLLGQGNSTSDLLGSLIYNSN